MNRTTAVLLALLAALGGVGVYLATRKPDPPVEGPGPDKPPGRDGDVPQKKEFEGSVREVKIEAVFPPKDARGGLDPFTRQTIELVEELLPVMRADPWPSRFACLSDTTTGDTRTVVLRLDKTLHVRGRAVGKEFHVTVRSEDDAAPRSYEPVAAGSVTVPGGAKPDRYTTITSAAGLRAACRDLADFQRLAVAPPEPKGDFVPLCSRINFGVEVHELRTLVVADAAPNGDGEGVRVTVGSVPFEMVLARAGDGWRVTRFKQQAGPGK